MFREAWTQLRCLLTRLLDSRDPSADSLVVGLLVIVGPMPLGLLICVLFGTTFDWQGYGIGGGAILAGAGGGVGARALMAGKAKLKDAPDVQ